MSRLRVVAVVAPLVWALAGCSAEEDDEPSPPAEPLPEVGACRVLAPTDVERPSNDFTVDCDEPHTAETYLAGSLPGRFDGAAYDDAALGAFAYRTCSEGFVSFVGADESLAMRTVLSWAWFRPTEEAWADGARWYRCDVVGGGAQDAADAASLDLPPTVRDVLLGRPDDRWLVCVAGRTVDTGTKVPCDRPHSWRAVTTIKVGQPDEDYPGDRVVEVLTRDYCSDSVGAWLGYPASFDFGYTWFHEAEWDAGNRRSVCWAKTKS